MNNLQDAEANDDVWAVDPDGTTQIIHPETAAAEQAGVPTRYSAMADDEPLGETVVAAPPRRRRRPDTPRPRRARSRSYAELLSFTGLILTLLLVLAGVTILRPLIFDQMVPAVLGTSNRALVAPLPEKNVTDVEEASVDEVENTGSEGTGGNGEVESGAGAEELETSTGDGTADAEPAGIPAAQPDTPTAIPALRHTVQSGETLTTIATRYGIPLSLIVSANQIIDPDRIFPGTELIIPQPPG